MINRRRFICSAVGAAALLGTGLGIDGWVERSDFEVSEHAIGATTGRTLRIAFLSDMHRSWATPQSVLQQAVQTCMSLQPDLILLGGDYISNARDLPLMPECADTLSALHAPDGVYYVLGNHDHWSGAKAIRQHLDRVGFTDMTNCNTMVRDGVHLVGLDDTWSGHPDVDKAFRGTQTGRRVVLSHNPRIFPRVRDRNCTVICGHTHGGQINIPLLPNPMMRSWKTYVQGWFHEDTSSMYVNRGVGTLTLPLRINCRPEITVLTLSV